MQNYPSNKQFVSPEVAEIRRLSSSYSGPGWLTPQMRELVLNLDVDRLVANCNQPTVRASATGSLGAFAVGVGLLSGGLIAILSLAV